MSFQEEFFEQCDNNLALYFTLLLLVRSKSNAASKQFMRPSECFQYLKQHTDIFTSEDYIDLTPRFADIVSFKMMEFMIALVADGGNVEYDDIDVKSTLNCLDTLYGEAKARDCYLADIEFSLALSVENGRLHAEVAHIGPSSSNISYIWSLSDADSLN